MNSDYTYIKRLNEIRTKWHKNVVHVCHMQDFHVQDHKQLQSVQSTVWWYNHEEDVRELMGAHRTFSLGGSGIK